MPRSNEGHGADAGGSEGAASTLGAASDVASADEQRREGVYEDFFASVYAISVLINESARAKGFYRDYEAIKLAIDAGSGTDQQRDTLLAAYEVHWRLARVALMHSELSEAVEAIRKPDGGNLGEELADVLIRLLDSAREWDVELADEVTAKMDVNRARAFMHGKLA